MPRRDPGQGEKRLAGARLLRVHPGRLGVLRAPRLAAEELGEALPRGRSRRVHPNRAPEDVLRTREVALPFAQGRAKLERRHEPRIEALGLEKLAFRGIPVPLRGAARIDLREAKSRDGW